MTKHFTGTGDEVQALLRPDDGGRLSLTIVLF
jgi:hypothetical protein